MRHSRLIELSDLKTTLWITLTQERAVNEIIDLVVKHIGFPAQGAFGFHEAQLHVSSSFGPQVGLSNVKGGCGVVSAIGEQLIGCRRPLGEREVQS